MSTNLYWKPAIKTGEGLSDQLKFALRKRYGWPVSAICDENSIAYLQGLADADVRGAAELIAAIEKHGEVEIFEL